MIAGAFLFERRIPLDELRATFARLLGIPATLIELLSDEGPSPRGGAILEIIEREGEFVQDVAVYVDNSLQVDPDVFAAAVVEAFQTRALISDDSVNPYSMILLAPGAAPVKIFLDVDSLDEHEQIKIDRVQTANG